MPEQPPLWADQVPPGNQQEATSDNPFMDFSINSNLEALKNHMTEAKFILQEFRQVASPKLGTRHEWHDIAYFSSVRNALKYYVDIEIRACRNLQNVLQKLNDLDQQINRIQIAENRCLNDLRGQNRPADISKHQSVETKATAVI